jgi:hypothetical protein
VDDDDPMMIRKVIAGVELLIKGLPDVEIREGNPVSEVFCTSENIAANDHRIHIQISAEPMPAVDRETILFRADPLWSIHRDNNFYWIVLHPPALRNPLWVARFDHDFSQGIVYCSEHLKDNQNGKAILFNPVSYPLDQILLMHFLAKIGGMLIHACGWLYHSSGWIFAGKSGAGKNTLSNLIVKATGSRFLSDDRIIIRKAGHEFLMYGTPWPGEAGYAMNQSAPLKGIFFLKKGSENKIEKLNPADSFASLMPVVSIPWYDRNTAELMVTFNEAMLKTVPLYDLTFVPDEAIVDMLIGFVNI